MNTPQSHQKASTVILLCGPYPPPVGGVSTHLARLSELLKDKGFSVLCCDDASKRKPDIYNIRSLNLYMYLKLIIRSDILHIHSSIDTIRLFHLIFAFFFRKRAIVTIHSWRKNSFISLLWSFAFRNLTEKVIAVNDKIFEKINLPGSMRITQPAFIPPPEQHRPLPTNISEFIQSARTAGKHVACTNAFRLVISENVDLYGIDLCLELFRSSDISNRCVLVCAISDPSINEELINRYTTFIKDHGLANTIYLQLGPIDFCTLLIQSDFSIRATNSDGDALSIRESIHFQKPCVASDCVERPKSTILFSNRSLPSLHSVVTSLLDMHHISLQVESVEDSTNFYLGLYQGKK